ncbi:HNH endonuclease [Rhodococcus sp. IEGM 1351]|uniref:HNH endonuclease n=1 Tax=Rhodococcus sp. IEGM 1351 TaxID=3047089 RepID=UPI0024B83BBF|nr:HNH endonuclease [Rhodococcus sp. IEGM 1351]MDI9934672.1 HNH endonuclease [Rhodococcus sp. IEGM 1351]
MERKLGRPLEQWEQVDHEDTDPTNCRRNNLRLATHLQNNLNHGLRSDNKSGYKGVWFDKNLNKFTAYIRLNGTRIHLGVFVDKLEAAVAYDSAAIQLFGNYANLNIIGRD